MATKSERVKAESQRTGKAGKAKPAKAPTNNGHVAKKAAYAREELAAGGQPSRRSSRKSANHSKTDTGMVRAEKMKESSPQTPAAKNRPAAEARSGKPWAPTPGGLRRSPFSGRLPPPPPLCPSFSGGLPALLVLAPLSIVG